MSTITMSQARTLYTAANNAGAGYAPDESEVSEAVEALNGDVILERETSEDVAVILDGRDLVAIGGDAMGRNAWAVTVVDDRKIMRLSNEAACAGDLETVATCERAATGDRDAILTVACILADTAAQAD